MDRGQAGGALAAAWAEVALIRLCHRFAPRITLSLCHRLSPGVALWLCQGFVDSLNNFISQYLGVIA